MKLKTIIQNNPDVIYYIGVMSFGLIIGYSFCFVTEVNPPSIQFITRDCACSTSCMEDCLGMRYAEEHIDASFLCEKGIINLSGQIFIINDTNIENCLDIGLLTSCFNECTEGGRPL